MKRNARKGPGGRTRVIVIAGVSVMLAACFTHTAMAEASDPDPCTLLTDQAIVDVQGAPVSERVASTQEASAFRVLQCLFKTSDLSSSVSAALTLDDGSGGALRYWRERFDADVSSGGGRDDPPKPVPDLGDAAFWVGDPFSGALYVLVGDRFLRISVGGATDEETRFERCRALAAAALPQISA